MKTGLLIFFSTLLWATGFAARAICELVPVPEYPASGVQTFTAPIMGGTISVPPGANVGDVIYRQKIKISNAIPAHLECSESAIFYFRHQYGVRPKPLSSYSNKVYQTGLAGIGIRFMVSTSTNYDYTSSGFGDGSCTTFCNHEADDWYWANEFQLIKTANTISSGVIEASDLPVIQYLFGQLSSMVLLHEVSLSGSITITAPTCDITTASKTMSVAMGKYKTDVFTGQGSSTDWKDASIILNNCGTFSGKLSPGESMAMFDGTTTTTTATLASNTWSLKLTPYSDILDATNGIMDIDDNPMRATGIGIQLSTTQSTSGLVNLNNAIMGTLPNDGTTNITLPLYARYIQTGSSVFAGKANGRLMYTITYQ